MTSTKPTPAQKRAILAAIDNGGRTSSDPYQLRTITALLRAGWMVEPDGRTLEVTDAGREAIQAAPNLSEAMTKALIELSMGNVIAGGPTLAALRRRGLVALIDRSGRDKRTVRLTKAGREAVAPILKAREDAEAKAAQIAEMREDPEIHAEVVRLMKGGFRDPGIMGRNNVESRRAKLAAAERDMCDCMRNPLGHSRSDCPTAGWVAGLLADSIPVDPTPAVESAICKHDGRPISRRTDRPNAAWWHVDEQGGRGCADQQTEAAPDVIDGQIVETAGPR